MSSANKVFLIGPGFIGSEVLGRLVQDKYQVTTLVRRESYAAEITKLGATVVLGNLDDKKLIQKHASESDIVIHTATADHLPSVEAVIDGVEQRAKDGQSTIYIHTSGTSQLSDDSEGGFKGEKIYSDDKPQDIDALPDSASHREIDLAIIRARERLGSKAKLVIVLPPLIYGVSSRTGRVSIQLPTLTRFALKHGYAAHVGDGLSVWSHIHVADLARAYVTILHWLEKNDAGVIKDNPYFFCENGQEHSWGECAAAIGKTLHKAGRIQDPQPRTVPKELYDDLFGMYTAWVVGSNSRSRAKRVRDLGWKPTEKESLASLTEDEIPIILKEKGEFKGYAGVAASGAGS